MARPRSQLVCFEAACGRFKAYSWTDWLKASDDLAAGLQAAGVTPGTRVAVVLENSFAACAALLGVWRSGAQAVSLPLPSRAMAGAAYVAMVNRMLLVAKPVLLVCGATTARRIQEVGTLATPMREFESLPKAGARAVSLAPDDAVVFAQFSSGSTREPRACELTANAIASQLEALVEGLRLDVERDVLVSWLPLSHDMGLFGCLMLAYWAGVQLVLSTPERFLMDPRSWLDDCSTYRATLGAMPPFGLSLVARVGESWEGAEFPMRALVLGSDRIDERILRAAVRGLERASVSWQSLTPAYGLAEATLAVTMASPGDGPVTHGGELGSTTAPEEITVVSSGRAVVNASVRIDAAAGRPGTIEVQSSSLAAGYLGSPAEQLPLTSDGYLRTNDLGVIQGGELFVLGRTDDVIVLRGRNIFAGDLEASLSNIRDLRRGCVAVVEDAGRLFVLAELGATHRGTEDVERQIRANLAHAAGVRVNGCVFLGAGRLPKTPSGKIQRYRCREFISQSGL